MTSVRITIGTYFGLLLVWALLFHSSLLRLIDAWAQSTTFTHCFFIFPICVYLIYERRRYFFTTDIIPSRLALVLLVGDLGLWYLGEVALMNILSDIAIVCFPALLFICVFGWRLSRIYAFALAFSVFALPIGEELIPHLQQITADISVSVLRLMHIPVFRDGLYIDIPNGRFHVAEACSGVRFLLSTIMMGALLSYFYFERIWAKVGFLLASFLVPIVANGIRAFLIIAIGHYTSMEHATGFDHLVYGWVFFSVVTLLMFVAAVKLGKMRPLEQPANGSSRAIPPNAASAGQTFAGGGNVSVCRLLMCVGLVMSFMILSIGANWRYQSQVQSVQTRNSHEQNIEPLGRKWSPIFFAVDHVVRQKVGDVEFIQLRYDFETPDKELINWKNQLYSPDYWAMNSSQRVVAKGGAYQLLSITSQDAQEKRLVGYFYAVNDQYYTSAFDTKMAQLWAKLSGKDIGGSIYLFSIPYSPDKWDMATTAIDHAIQLRIHSIN